jgi:hypothetical protein
VDNWNILHHDQLEDIGFKQNGQYRMDLREPRMSIVYLKDVGFVLIDISKKEAKTFKNFSGLSNHLMTYQQSWRNAPYTDTGEK